MMTSLDWLGLSQNSVNRGRTGLVRPIQFGLVGLAQIIQLWVKLAGRVGLNVILTFGV